MSTAAEPIPRPANRVKDEMMGEVRIRARLTNVVDAALARRGQLPTEEVRIYDTEAVVDTGAVRTVIPLAVAQALGVEFTGELMAEYADGRRESVPVTDAVRVDIEGRDTVEECLVLGDEVLIGQTVLEKTDFLVDCANMRLVPNPEHPEQPVSKVRSLVIEVEKSLAEIEKPPAPDETLADLVERLGDIPLSQIKLHPAPGTATEEDVVRFKCCELLDSVIVEKGMGWEEAIWENILGEFLGTYLQKNRIAVVAGASGLTRLEPGRVRIPDLGVYLLSRFPDGKAKRAAICDIAPDWAIEVMSRSNTRREMEINREHFFAAGTQRVWIVDPRKRTIEDWTTPKQMKVLTADDTVKLNPILPGFVLNVGEWFAEIDLVFEQALPPQGRDPSQLPGC